jgi:hypothetical protein
LAGEKRAQQGIWARGGFYRRGRLRKLMYMWYLWCGWAVLESGNLFKGGAVLGSSSSEV